MILLILECRYHIVAVWKNSAHYETWWLSYGKITNNDGEEHRGIRVAVLRGLGRMPALIA